MRLINGDHLEERVRKIVKDYAQAAKDANVIPGRVIFSSCGVIGLVESESTVDAVPVQRCDGCRYANWHSNGCIAYCTKHRADGFVADDYCSYGKKDGGDGSTD